MENSRYRSMQQIQEKLLLEVKKLFIADVSNLNACLTSLLERKLRRPSVHSYFTFWIYKYIEQCARLEDCTFHALDRETSEVKLPFLAEAIISVMCLHYQVLDKKKEVRDNDSVSCNLLSGNLLKDRIYDYIQENFSTKEEKHIQYYTRRIFRSVDVGQFFDKFHSRSVLLEGNNPHIFEDKSLSKVIGLDAIKDIIGGAQQEVRLSKDAIAIYFERNYLISSALFRYLTELILVLTGYDGKEKENVIRFAECYGQMMQLVNDINDVVKEKGTTNKDSSDVLSDAKNEIVTLPMLIHFERMPKQSLFFKVFNGEESYRRGGTYNEILKELTLSGALKDAMKIGRKIAERAKSFLLQEGETSMECLSKLLSIAYNNRYYYHIYQAKKFYKKIEYREELYRCEENSREDSLEPKARDIEADVYQWKHFQVIRPKRSVQEKLVIAAT